MHEAVIKKIDFQEVILWTSFSKRIETVFLLIHLKKRIETKWERKKQESYEQEGPKYSYQMPSYREILAHQSAPDYLI